MRKFMSFIVLYLVTASVFADGSIPPPILPPGGDASAPEPEVLSLLGIGALAFLVAHRKKK